MTAEASFGWIWFVLLGGVAWLIIGTAVAIAFGTFVKAGKGGGCGRA